MTRVTFRLRGLWIPLDSPLPWDRVLDMVGRAFYPDTHIGGPALPPPESTRKSK